MTAFSVTEFQARCRGALVRVLEDSTVNYSFEYAQGKKDSYLVYDLAVERRQIKVYIYGDEAGFFVGKKWFVFEAQSYPDPETLITHFTEASSSTRPVRLCRSP